MTNHNAMGDESNSAAAGDAEQPELKRRNILGVGSIMIGLPLMLWLVTAFIVARSLKYPAFLYEGTGADVFGDNVPRFIRGSVTNIRTATGIEPQRFDSGTVQEDGFRGRTVPVIGWYFAGSRPEVIVLLPSAGGNELQIIPYVKFLHAAGYTVVASYSSNNPKYGINWGLLKCKFALATAHQLRQEGFDSIAVLGIAEGGAGAILAQAEEPVFKAIVADSSYASLTDTLLNSQAMAGLNPAFAHTVLWEGHFWLGKNLFHIQPVKSVTKIGACPLLIIQNQGDPMTPLADGVAISKAASGPTELWITPSKGHADAIFQDPKKYGEHVIAFLDKTFGPYPAVAQAQSVPAPAAAASPAQSTSKHPLRDRLKSHRHSITPKNQS